MTCLASGPWGALIRSGGAARVEGYTKRTLLQPLCMASPLESTKANEKAPTLSFERFVESVRGVGNWRSLGIWLEVPDSVLNLLEQHHGPDDDCMQTVIQQWLLRDPKVSWRKLICGLDWIGETKVADSIRNRAEPVKDPTLTVQNVYTVLQPVKNWYTLSYKMVDINVEYSTEEQRRSVVEYYVQMTPCASWENLARMLYHMKEEEALEAAKKYCHFSRDPSLTFVNLIAVLEKLKNWNMFGLGLGIPFSKRFEIRQLYEHDDTDQTAHTVSQGKADLLSYWLRTYPGPSWELVATALQNPVLGEHGLAEVVTTKYIRASEESKQIFKNAMKYGVVRARNLKFLIMGFAGVGKSHVLAMILGENPPAMRCSTPCLTRPVRLRRIARIGNHWGRMGERELCVVVASAAKAQPLKVPVHSDDISTISQVHTFQRAQQKSAVKVTASPDIPTQHQAHFEPPSNDGSYTGPQRDPPSSPKVNIEDELLRMIESASGAAQIDLDLISGLDTGGQPHFLEVLPNYLDKNTTIIIVLKLSEELSAHPIVEYFNENGELVGPNPHYSAFTNQQTLGKCMRALRTQMMKSFKGRCPKVVIIGTHKDLEDSCRETREEKNVKLLEMLPPGVQDHIVYYGEEMKEVIFPINAKMPGIEEEKIALKLREYIVEDSFVEPIDIPLQWYGFDVALQELMKIVKRGVLSKAECRDVAQRLHFTEESFEAALKFLASLNILHYYDTVLPEVVFADPQVPLDKLNELVHCSYKLRQNPTSQEFTEGHFKKFRDQGIVTIRNLKKFPRHFIQGLFTPSELLQLFTMQLTVAEIRPGEYFMPLLLGVATRRKQLQICPVIPLLFYFPDGPLLGFFCALISYLLSHAKWKLLMYSGSPVHVTRNNISFEIPGGVPGRLTVTDSLYSYFEVSIHIPPTLPPDIYSKACPRIRQDLLDGMYNTSSSLGYSDSIPQEAFFCPVQSEACCLSPHPAIVHCSYQCLRCTVNPGEVFAMVTESHRIWFATAEDRAKDQRITSASGRGELSKVNCSGLELKKLVCLPVAAEWKLLGLQLNVPQDTLNTIQSAHIGSPQSPKHCLTDMFDWWLNNSEAATCEMLEEALINVDRRDVAISLRTKDDVHECCTSKRQELTAPEP